MISLAKLDPAHDVSSGFFGVKIASYTTAVTTSEFSLHLLQEINISYLTVL
jgi:hypothetical protein